MTQFTLMVYQVHRCLSAFFLTPKQKSFGSRIDLTRIRKRATGARTGSAKIVGIILNKAQRIDDQFVTGAV